MRILAIPGSLRADSLNRRLLRAAVPELPAGATLDIYDGLAGIPAYDEDAEGSAPASVVAFRDAVAVADAVLLATPEYNSSIPGALKNALDWGSRPYRASAFESKPAAVVGASPGLFGAVWAQAELRKVLDAMGAEVVDRELPVGQAAEAFDSDGRLKDSGLRETFGGILGELTARVGVASGGELSRA
jgi:chromate reductase, NAD(P)H dehydrogenase (quinone)